MLKRFVMFSLVAGAMLAAAPRAEAAQIVGALSLSSKALCPGCTSVIPVISSTGTPSSLDLATGLDFTAGGVLSPGVAGLFEVDNTIGDFNVVFGKTGFLQDFTFSGPGTVDYPSAPFLFQLILADGFSFTVETMVVANQGGGFLDLRGTGVFTLAGFDATPGEFRWQSNTTGGVFSFGGTEVARPIPEPGSMLLLGTGLLSLGSALRRKLAR